MRAILRGSRDLAPDVRHFLFEVENVSAFPFQPGQFVSLSGDVNGKRITRAYSIASVPDGNRFEICLNRVHDGIFSPKLFAMREGDAVDIKGPVGTFGIRDAAADMVMAATGTGVAPFRSMIRHHLDTGGAGRITLVFGVRYEKTLLYRTDFEQWARDNPRFRFWPTLSRPEPDWQGRTGHVQAHVLEAVGERRDCDVYICGLKLMVDDLRRRLLELGFEKKRLIFEKYD